MQLDDNLKQLMKELGADTVIDYTRERGQEMVRDAADASPRKKNPNAQKRMEKLAQFGVLLDMMTPLTRKFGPDLNRDTVGNVLKAGFRLRRVENVYMDIVRIIEAVKEPGG